VIHSTVSFITKPTEGWRYQDASTSVLFDILVFFIHVFRMPLFSGLGSRLGTLIHHPLGVLIGTATTFLTLLPMRSAALDTETVFLVRPKILLAYGVFVGFGWVLYLNRQELDRFAKRRYARPSMPLILPEPSSLMR
jgi:hypothetical protein